MRILLGGVGAAALLAIALAASNADRIGAILGRDATLTGRTTLWSAAVRIGREQPWIGHGYATFAPRAHAGGTLSHRKTGLPVQHPHNGFIEIFFELGLIGVLSVVLPLLVLLWRAWSSALSQPGTSLWPATSLLFLLLTNIAESGLLRHKVFWALYIAAAVDVWGSAGRWTERKAANLTPRRSPA